MFSILRKCVLNVLSVESATLGRRNVAFHRKMEKVVPPRGVGKIKANQDHLKFRHIYPEFLPNPIPKHRNLLREKVERQDMLNRRTVIDIPEFYAGSILAVTLSDVHAQGKTNRFVGICIEKFGYGLRSKFVLRNVVDHQGIEVTYDLYDPLIQKIQVLRLEKRLDSTLRYLRDAPLEYSTFSFDMEPEILPDGAEVPVNRIMIELNPKPWREKYQLQGFKGIIITGYKRLSFKDKKKLEKFATPWEKYDLMKEYRKVTPEEEQTGIWSEVYTKLQDLETVRKKISRKRVFLFPKKSA